MKEIDKKTRELETLYRVGNFAAAVALSKEIQATDNGESETATATNKIRAAMEPDPAAIVVFGCTLFALLFISIKYLL